MRRSRKVGLPPQRLNRLGDHETEPEQVRRGTPTAQRKCPEAPRLRDYISHKSAGEGRGVAVGDNTGQALPGNTKVNAGSAALREE